MEVKAARLGTSSSLIMAFHSKSSPSSSRSTHRSKAQKPKIVKNRKVCPTCKNNAVGSVRVMTQTGSRQKTTAAATEAPFFGSPALLMTLESGG